MDGFLGIPLRIFADDDELLGQYVPTLVLQWLRDRPDQRHRAIDCTLVFADISGVASSSEPLAYWMRAR